MSFSSRWVAFLNIHLSLHKSPTLLSQRFLTFLGPLLAPFLFLPMNEECPALLSVISFFPPRSHFMSPIWYTLTFISFGLGLDSVPSGWNSLLSSGPYFQWFDGQPSNTRSTQCLQQLSSHPLHQTAFSFSLPFFSTWTLPPAILWLKTWASEIYFFTSSHFIITCQVWKIVPFQHLPIHPSLSLQMPSP